MAPDHILKMDQSGLKHGNEHHPLTQNEKKMRWNLVFSGIALKLLICSGTYLFRFTILIQGLIYNTWTQEISYFVKVLNMLSVTMQIDS